MLGEANAARLADLQLLTTSSIMLSLRLMLCLPHPPIQIQLISLMNSNLFSIHFCVGTLFLSLGMYIILLITFDGWFFVSGMAPLPSLLPSWVHLLEDQDGPVPLPPQPPAVGFLLYVFYFKKCRIELDGLPLCFYL